MEKLSFIEIIIIIVTLAFSIVAVKIGIKFDLNKYLERRDKKLLQKLQNNCTHIAMEYDEKTIILF